MAYTSALTPADSVSPPGVPAEWVVDAVGRAGGPAFTTKPVVGMGDRNPADRRRQGARQDTSAIDDLVGRFSTRPDSNRRARGISPARKT